MTLAEYLRAKGERTGSFARRAGLSHGYLSRLLRGERQPGAGALIRVREATGGAVTADEFLAEVEAARASAEMVESAGNEASR